MLSTVLLLLFLFQLTHGFMVTIDAHDTVCFYDRAHENDKITIRFEVMEGGFKDIAVHISGPEKDILYESQSETSGSYTFVATKDAKYTLCFDNERSTLTPKIIMFHFTVIKDLMHYMNPRKRADDVIEQASLQETINELSSSLIFIKHEQEYMHVRYNVHMDIRDSVHFRIMTWSIFGPSLLLTMTMVEVYYLKRFFEVKCVV